MSTEAKRDTIHEAANRGDLDVIRRFVEVEGVYADCQDEHGFTPLLKASVGRVPILSYIISKNANVEATVPTNGLYGCTPLLIVSYGDEEYQLEEMKMLLKQGHANPNTSRPGRDCTPLVLATRYESSLCFVPPLLRGRGSSAADHGHDGLTGLHIPCNPGVPVSIGCDEAHRRGCFLARGVDYAIALTPSLRAVSSNYLGDIDVSISYLLD